MKNFDVTDVFLSCSQSETAWAAEVRVRFGDAGLKVFTDYGANAGTDLDGLIWDALVESSALIALIRSPRGMSDTLSFEIGAAMTWEKPVYVLYKGERPTGLPKYAEQFGMFPASEIDKLVRLVAGKKGFSDRERQALEQAYAAVGVPADRLLLDVTKLDELEKNFNKLSKSRFSGEQLLREILRLRKQRKLPSVGLKRKRAVASWDFAKIGCLGINDWRHRNREVQGILIFSTHTVRILKIPADLKQHWVPVLYQGPFDIEQIRLLREGKETLSGSALHIKEGCVVTPVAPRDSQHSTQRFRLALKLINPKFVEDADAIN